VDCQIKCREQGGTVSAGRPASFKTLAEVRKHTGRQLTYAEAIRLANPGDPFLRNMAVALSLSTPGTTLTRTGCAWRQPW
jgi:hypothetical protein